MTTHETTYDLLADLLAYPRADYRARVEHCREALAGPQPEAAGLLADFQSETHAMSPDELEELFTRTFDCNPPCALEIGWHLFGENYDRGAFLVWMREQLRRCAVPESAELPDHLTHVLAVLGRMDGTEADNFAASCVLPALERLLPALDEKGNPYEKTLKAIASTIRANHESAGRSHVPLPVIQPEMNIAIELNQVLP